MTVGESVLQARLTWGSQATTPYNLKVASVTSWETLQLQQVVPGPVAATTKSPLWAEDGGFLAMTIRQLYVCTSISLPGRKMTVGQNDLVGGEVEALTTYVKCICTSVCDGRTEGRTDGRTDDGREPRASEWFSWLMV